MRSPNWFARHLFTYLSVSSFSLFCVVAAVSVAVAAVDRQNRRLSLLLHVVLIAQKMFKCFTFFHGR